MFAAQSNYLTSTGVCASRRALQHACAVFALLLLAASVAHAQPAGRRTSPDYQGLISEGLHAYADKRYADARKLFATAHAMEASARTLRALGVADLALDNFSMAKDELEASLTHHNAPLSAEQRKEVTDLLSWMRANLGTVQLQCTPVHAEAKIDGRAVQSPEVLLEPEEHELAVSAPGYEPEVRRFQVVLARPQTLHVELVASVPSAPRALTAHEMPVPEPRPTSASARPSQTWLWVGGAGAVLAAAGGSLLILGLNDKARVEDAPTGARLSDLTAAHDRVPWLTGTGFALGALGVGGLGAAAIMLLTRQPRRADVGWKIHLAPNGAGLSAHF